MTLGNRGQTSIYGRACAARDKNVTLEATSARSKRFRLRHWYMNGQDWRRMHCQGMGSSVYVRYLEHEQQEGRSIAKAVAAPIYFGKIFLLIQSSEDHRELIMLDKWSHTCIIQVRNVIVSVLLPVKFVPGSSWEFFLQYVTASCLLSQTQENCHRP